MPMCRVMLFTLQHAVNRNISWRTKINSQHVGSGFPVNQFLYAVIPPKTSREIDSLSCLLLSLYPLRVEMRLWKTVQRVIIIRSMHGNRHVLERLLSCQFLWALTKISIHSERVDFNGTGMLGPTPFSRARKEGKIIGAKWALGVFSWYDSARWA